MEDLKRFLNDVPEDKSFFLDDGTKIRNLEELRDELRFMKLDTFSKYVNDAKNDFVNWIRDVIGDQVLADRLTQTKDKEKTLNIINSRLIYLKIKTEKEEDKKIEDIQNKLSDLKKEVDTENKHEIETLEKEEEKENNKKPTERSRILLEEDLLSESNKPDEKNREEAKELKEQGSKEKETIQLDKKKLDTKVKISMGIIFIVGVIVGYLIGKLI